LPLYEYQCAACGRFELIQKFSDAPLSACPTCGGEVQKLLSAPAIQFKGTGWYVTDYARKSSPSERSAKEGSANDKDTTSSSSTDTSTPNKTTSKDDSATGSSPSK
jgi:putative FmdB family regulatory protein